MPGRRLPIGIQTFRELRAEGCHYVDKTPYVERMVREGKHYFLSRPRRFGKSLFLDTLKEFFAGSEELFAGLYIHHRHDWSQRHPVVRLSFGGGTFQGAGIAGPGRDGATGPSRGTTRSRCGTTPQRRAFELRRRCGRRANGWPCWWTSTTSRSWTHSMEPRQPRLRAG